MKKRKKEGFWAPGLNRIIGCGNTNSEKNRLIKLLEERMSDMKVESLSVLAKQEGDRLRIQPEGPDLKRVGARRGEGFGGPSRKEAMRWWNLGGRSIPFFRMGC